MNKRDDDKYISSKKDVVMRISEEKIRVWQQKELNEIEEEIRKQEQKENWLTEVRKIIKCSMRI